MFNKKLRLEIVELEERILQLEKRVEDYRRNGKLMYGALLDTVNDYHEELDEEIKIIKRDLKKKGDKNGETNL